MKGTKVVAGHLDWKISHEINLHYHDLSTKVALTHSVEITEILSHAFLAKISLK